VLSKDHPAVREMAFRILCLIETRRLTLCDLRRRARGYGADRLLINFGRAVSVSPTFGAALEGLAFAGMIRLESGRRDRVYVAKGRNFYVRAVPA
jgi:hypothetical protein